MAHPLVSIIVTCYNQAHCIARTLDSVKGQTYSNWECIVVDDGSNDNSATVIKDTIKSDKRFKYVYQDNTGVSKARNAGFILAKGEYINFLDGDDTFLPEKLQAQLQVFKANPEIAICICDHQHFDECKDTYKYFEYEQLSTKPLEQLLYGWHNGVAFPLHAALYVRTLWEVNQLPFNEIYSGRAEDWIFNIEIALKGHPYYHMNKVLCSYHHINTSFTINALDNETAYLNAAVHIYNFLKIPDKNKFLNTVFKETLLRFADSKKHEFYKTSGNWRLGNYITKPLLWFKKKMLK